LAREPGNFAILESPFYARTSVQYMFFQTIHGKPMVGGYLARQMPYPALEQLPILRMFAYARPERDIIAQEPAAIAASVFSTLNIRYLILHSEGGALRYNTLLRVAEAAAGGQPPERETLPGRSFLAYRVTLPAVPVPFVGIGAGWSEVETRPDGGVQRRNVDRAEIIVYNPGRQALTLTLQVQGTRSDALRVEIEGQETVSRVLTGADETITVPIAAGVERTIVQVVVGERGEIVVTSVDVQQADISSARSEPSTR
jgi:hypothetical protein